MLHEQIVTLSKYRLDKAKETYATALENLKNNRYLDANNRAYYSIFHAMRAVLALDGVDFKKHTAVISNFRESYIKTNRLDRVLSDIIGRASIVRNKSDYEDFYVTSINETEEQVNDAKVFIDVIEEYLKGKW
jgi:uncharacterized protein (UPF0332 family)